MEKNKVDKVYNQIHAPENLKQETYKKMISNETKKKTNYSFILSIAAMFIFTFAVGTVYYTNRLTLNNEISVPEKIAFET